MRALRASTIPHKLVMISSHECPRIVDLIVPMCDAVANLDRPRSHRHINNTSQARVVDAPRQSFACKPIRHRRKGLLADPFTRIDLRCALTIAQNHSRSRRLRVATHRDRP